MTTCPQTHQRCPSCPPSCNKHAHSSVVVISFAADDQQAISQESIARTACDIGVLSSPYFFSRTGWKDSDSLLKWVKREMQKEKKSQNVIVCNIERIGLFCMCHSGELQNSTVTHSVYVLRGDCLWNVCSGEEDTHSGQRHVPPVCHKHFGLLAPSRLRGNRLGRHGGCCLNKELEVEETDGAVTTGLFSHIGSFSITILLWLLLTN